MRTGSRCAAAALLAVAALALDFSTLRPTGYVSDFAGVVDGAAEAEINRYCARVKELTGAEIALVTIASLEGEPVEDTANLLFRQWGVGSKETNEGILLLLAIRDRKTRIEVGYGLEPLIPDGLAGSLLREMRPALRERRYADALIAAARGIGERIAASKGVRLDQPLRPRMPPETSPAFPAWLLPPLLFAILYLMGMRRGRGRRGRGLWGWGGGAWPMLPPIGWGGLSGEGGWRHRAGGGFGGYDSGGSFGGFGGGDSGGGGASGSW